MALSKASWIHQDASSKGEGRRAKGGIVSRFWRGYGHSSKNPGALLSRDGCLMPAAD